MHYKKNHMKRKTFAITFICLVSASALLAEDVDTSKLPPVNTKQEVDFVRDIKPLFEKSCFGCHGAKPRAKSKYFMNTRQTAIEGGSSKEAAIVVGKSDQSPLVHFIADLIEEMEMPPLDNRDKYPKITKEQIALIRAWIDQGAKWPDDVKLALPE